MGNEVVARLRSLGEERAKMVLQLRKAQRRANRLELLLSAIDAGLERRYEAASPAERDAFTGREA